MADNVDVVAGVATYKAAADELSYSGETAQVQLARLVHVSGSEGSKTLTEMVGVQGSPGAAALSVQRLSASAHHFVAAATANAANVKASAGRLLGFSLFNKSDVPIYLKFHNTAGTPTAGASVVRTFGIQAGVGRDFMIPGGGLAFATGIGFTLVQDLADSGTTATAANDAVGEIFYE